MRHETKREAGVALIITLLTMLVFTLMCLGFYFVVTGEQKIAASDRDNAVAFYGGEAALEKMSSDLAAFFVTHTAPTPSQIDALAGTANQPTIPGVTFPTAGGYTILYQTATGGTTLASTVKTIGGSGPFAGLQGLVTPFTLQVIADGPNGTEVKLTRDVQEVAVPVFQFGIFSENDLSFFAGPDFNFGGRVHTNANLFVAEGSGNTLTLGDRVTAYQDVIRTQLSNTWATSSNYTGTVNVLRTPGNFRALASNEGSVVGGPGSAPYSGWNTLSLSTYNGNIRTRATGAKQLNLALALAGATPIEILRRPPVGEDPTTTIGSSRFFNQASMRIILSDTAAAITGLPGVTTNAPLPLDASVNTGSPATRPTDSCHPPVALSPGWTADNDFMSPANTTLLGGYIKIEIQLNATPGTWQDVTQEILSLGISRDIQSSGTMTPAGCTNISVLHLERAKPGVTLNSNAVTTTATSFVPINMYDTREGEVRDVAFSTKAAPSLSTASSGSLILNHTYYYMVTAMTNCCEIPGTEASKKITSSSNKKINVSWTAYSGATGYRVYRATSSGAYSGYFSVAAGTTSLNDDGVTWSDGGTPPNTGSPPAATVSLNGIMNLVEVDVGNLQKWFANTLCTGATFPTSCPSGALALKDLGPGYILYVSDRRGNNTDTTHQLIGNVTGTETGEYGNEDTINSASSTGTPNASRETAEDVNANSVLDTYGATAHPIAVDSTSGSTWPACMAAVATDNPAFTRITTSAGQKNSVVVFRRALRLVNGALGKLPPLSHANCGSGTGGFTVVAENPVYVLGNYNADTTNGFNNTTSLCHVGAAVIGDSVTLLSSNWQDSNSFTYPTDVGSRSATTTWYRTGIISGKNLSFLKPAGYTCPQDFGTDGGTHNFLRYIEDWGSQTLNYRGSIVSFYIARQATGIYKCCTTVYSPPTRGYNFDVDFLNISLLPPGTPRFTDVNALSFKQAILPTQ